MHIPLTGVIFIPLTVLVFLLWPSHLEELLLYMAVFQAAAVLNLNGGFTFGLSPYFFTAAMLAPRVGIKWHSGRIRFRRSEFTQKHLRLAALFIVWCVISAFALPILFEGVPVDSARAAAEGVFYSALPLKWSFSNAGQAAYMVLNFGVLLAFADFSTRRPLESLMDAFTYSGVIVIIVALYQMIANSFGLPFPTSFFNSNGTWAQNYNQMIGAGWHRVSATFVEPSEAGGFLSSWLMFELILANWGSTRKLRHWIFAIIGCAMLLATSSSTGYVTVALALLYMAGRLTLEALQRGRLLIRTSATVAVVVLVGLAFLTLSSAGLSLLGAVLWNKAGSGSAVVRLATVWRALSVIQDTYGLGAGLGSNRSFGMLAYIGSNLGIFGLVVFLYMLIHLFGTTLDYIRADLTSTAARTTLVACAAALSANLIGQIVSGAEISEPRTWVLWGMLVAAVRATATGNCGADQVSEVIPSGKLVLVPSPVFR
jgi:hypothetical protein